MFVLQILAVVWVFLTAVFFGCIGLNVIAKNKLPFQKVAFIATAFWFIIGIVPVAAAHYTWLLFLK